MRAGMQYHLNSYDIIKSPTRWQYILLISHQSIKTS